MRRTKVKNIFYKCIIALLITVFISSPFAGNHAITTLAATTDHEEDSTIHSYSTKEPTPTASLQKNLPADSSQAADVEALGMSSEQPVRTSPSGKEVDKTQSPLGPNTVVINRNYQLAYAYGTNQAAYSNAIGSNTVNMIMPLGTYNTKTSTFNPIHKKLIAVDVDGNGTQELAEVGFTGTLITGFKLQFYITDYNADKNQIPGSIVTPTSSSVYTVASMKTYTDMSITYATDTFYCTSGDIDRDGKDEIIIATGNTIYICKADLQNFKCVSTTIGTSIDDIQALDANQDGFPELMVVANDLKAFRGEGLYIYNSSDLSTPAARISLSLGPIMFIKATVDVGDIFGDGDQTIVIGGRTQSGAYLSYVKYYPETDSYDEKLPKLYSMLSDSQTLFSAVRSDLQVKCVSLDTPVEGTPESIVLGGYIFTYSQADDIFERQSISVYYENSSNVSANKSDKTEDNITDTNYKNDDTYIIETLVGNFDGNDEGKEQIIMLHYNKWYDREIAYVTECFLDDDGKMESRLSEIYRQSSSSVYTYPALAPVDIYNHSTKMELVSGSFVYSSPVITAVLGASPYYSELESEYTSLGNVDTTYGTESTSENSTSNGVTASVGVMFGYEYSYSLFDQELFKIEFETEVKNSFTVNWSSATSISKGISYTNYYSEDAVVLTVIPYDVYAYKATVWDKKTNTYQTNNVVVEIPYAPLTTMMTVDDYNKAALNIDNAPTIPDGMLQHTVGDPRTYPSSSSKLSNISGKSVLEYDSNDESSFIGTGVGNSSVEQSITNATTSSKSFDYELSIDVKVDISILGVKAGVSAGVGYQHNMTVSTTKSTTRSGSVASVPQGYSDYQFRWALVAYNYNLPIDKTTSQECVVISYICKPLGAYYPPKVPQNLSVSSQDLDTNSLRWDTVEGSDGYQVLRSTEKDNGYTPIATVKGASNNIYNDQLILTDLNRNYYYKIIACKGTLKTKATDQLFVPQVSATDMQIKTQPKLTYKEYDPLDLSSILVTLTLSSGNTMEIKYSDFDTYGITTSIQNGEELDSGSSGIPITVKCNSLSANTNTLTVKAYSIYPIDLTVNFTVGTTSNASALSVGKKVSASSTLVNNSTSSLKVIVTLALYDDKGTMIEYSSVPKTIEANETVICKNTLSSTVSGTGYTAKVFVWDGSSLSESNLTPLADFAQIF